MILTVVYVVCAICDVREEVDSPSRPGLAPVKQPGWIALRGTHVCPRCAGEVATSHPAVEKLVCAAGDMLGWFESRDRGVHCEAPSMGLGETKNLQIQHKAMLDLSIPF